MSDHRARGGDEISRAITRRSHRQRSGLEILPAGNLHRKPRVVAFPRGQFRISELQSRAQLAVVVGGQCLKLLINLLLETGQAGIRRIIPSQHLTRRRLVSRKQVQQLLQRTLKCVAAHFLRAKVDVLVDRGADDIQ